MVLNDQTKIMSYQPLKVIQNTEKKLPCNIEAEQALIGSILVSNDIYDEISNIIDAQKFFDPIHSKIFSTIEMLISKGLLANPITLKNYFDNNEGLKELGGQEYLIKITKFSTSVKQAIDYANIVHEMHVRRELIKISETVLNDASANEVSNTGEEMIQKAEKSLFDLAERGHFNRSFLKFENALKQTIEMARNAYQNEEGIVGVPTGLTDLDSRLGGMHKQDLIIIAGRPSMGKTALATNIAFHAAKNIAKKDLKSTVAFFSLEMSSEQLSTRILSEQAKIRSNDIRRGKVTEKEFEQFIETSKNIFDLPLYIDETPAITISAISNRSRRIKRLFGLELIVVDYIQLMRSSGDKRNDGRVQEISEITQGLKALAKELDVPVLALSQLSRAVEQRDDKKPQLADLRESGSIEQDADVVMFVYRAAYYLERKEPTLGSIEHTEWRQKMDEIASLAEIMIGKQRHGPTGNVKVEFEAMFTKFKDLEKK